MNLLKKLNLKDIYSSLQFDDLFKTRDVKNSIIT